MSNGTLNRLSLDAEPCGCRYFACHCEDVGCLTYGAQFRMCSEHRHGPARVARLRARVRRLEEALRYIVEWAPQGWSAEVARDKARAALAEQERVPA